MFGLKLLFSKLIAFLHEGPLLRDSSVMLQRGTAIRIPQTCTSERLLESA